MRCRRTTTPPRCVLSEPPRDATRGSFNCRIQVRRRPRQSMLREPLPIPLTDLRRRVNVARNLIRNVLTELVGPVELAFDFYREWNGCWRVRVEIKDPINGRLEFTLMLNLDPAVERPLECVPRGVRQGATRRRSGSTTTSCNAVGRRAGRAPGVVAAVTRRVRHQMTMMLNKRQTLACGTKRSTAGSRFKGARVAGSDASATRADPPLVDRPKRPV
jgi:hypothetical protein